MSEYVILFSFPPVLLLFTLSPIILRRQNVAATAPHAPSSTARSPRNRSLKKASSSSYRVVNAPDKVGDIIPVLPRCGHCRRRRCRPPNLDVADGVVAPPRDELVDVEDEADDDLDEHRQVQVPVDALLFGPQRPVRRMGEFKTNDSISFALQGSRYSLGQRFCVLCFEICYPSLFASSPLCGASFITKQALKVLQSVISSR